MKGISEVIMQSFTKKFFPIFAVVLVAFVGFTFAACQAGYSASSIKSNLTSSGYTVSEEYDIVFDQDTDHSVKASELAGIQKIYSVAKGATTDADREFAVILVFDSIQNAEKGINTDRLVILSSQATHQCGENKKTDTSMGQYNNVIFAGSSAIKSAAGL